MPPAAADIALLGGAFAPPTLAHVHIAQRLCSLQDQGGRPAFDAVWVLPSIGYADKPHLQHSFALRLALCQQAFAAISPQLHVKDDERRLAHPGTVHLLRRAKDLARQGMGQHDVIANFDGIHARFLLSHRRYEWRYPERQAPASAEWPRRGHENGCPR